MVLLNCTKTRHSYVKSGFAHTITHANALAVFEFYSVEILWLVSWSQTASDPVNHYCSYMNIIERTRSASEYRKHIR